MGSRRGRYAALAALIGACTSGAPIGFSGGESWSIPLIGPLEDGLLFVPVSINGKGPYVFALDPDANVSVVDEQVVKEAGLRTAEGPQLLDEVASEEPRLYGEVVRLDVGTLTIKAKSALIVPRNTYDSDGRRVHGVLGRDVIAESLVFAFDRDRGVVTLATQTAHHASSSGEPIHLDRLANRIENIEVVPVARRLAKAKIDGEDAVLHVDLGATASQLRERMWAKRKLAVVESHATLVDEVGTARQVNRAAVADTVMLGSATTPHVLFVPYTDRRWPEKALDGTLGLNFFQPYSVSINWETSLLEVKPRKPVGDAVAARIGRWQSTTLAACPHVGCVTVSMIDPLAGKPPEETPAHHPGLVVTFTRDTSASQLAIEVLVAVTSPTDKPPLQWLVANLPAAVDRVMTHLPADYIGATLTVVDASPFPRDCPTSEGCIDRLAPSSARTTAP